LTQWHIWAFVTSTCRLLQSGCGAHCTAESTQPHGGTHCTAESALQ
jgi:hypothetical protein